MSITEEETVKAKAIIREFVRQGKKFRDVKTESFIARDGNIHLNLFLNGSEVTSSTTIAAHRALEIPDDEVGEFVSGLISGLYVAETETGRRVCPLSLVYNENGTGEFFRVLERLVEIRGENFSNGVYGTYTEEEFSELYVVVLEKGEIIESSNSEYGGNVYFKQNGDACSTSTHNIEAINGN